MIITRDEAKALIPILQAFIQGKTIKIWNGVCQEGEEKQYVDLDTSSVLPLTHGNHCQINFKEYFKIENEGCAKTTNPCIGCKHHYKQYLLDGNEEWGCTYSVCKYFLQTANPKEHE